VHHEVVFIERPRDVRALLRGGRARWARGLRRSQTRHEGQIVVSGRSTLVPGHRGTHAGRLDTRLLSRHLREFPADVVVAMVPWEWPAVARCTGARRVFDCADSWADVLPGRRARMLAMYRQIADEADAIVVTSDKHASLFAPRKVIVVRNGTPSVLLDAELTAGPKTSTMVYAGTLSERFDVPLVDAVLAQLPDWRLEIYGPCQYEGRGDQPSSELADLLARWPKRAKWHGAVERDRLADKLDAGDVLVIPHRERGAVGGDAMKFYDYAARGRPVATTHWSDGIEAMAPPHTHIATTPAAFAAAVLDSKSEPAEYADARRRWAEANSWQARWEAWSAAVLG
jgi:glycosyltransferase involved in cell wall biosynthesis